MKKVLVFTLCCSMGIPVFANPVSQQQALQYAKEYLHRGHNRTLGLHPKGETLTLAHECLPATSRAVQQQQALYYVFNRGQEGGFIVVAGDDEITPVLGCTESGTFIKEQLNPGVQWWLKAVEYTVAHLAETPKVVTSVARNAAFAQEIKPLMETKWGQRAPYNNRCPVDNFHGEEADRSVTGCVAVATAQVLNKWKGVQPTGVIDYETPTHGMKIHEDLSTFHIDWVNMLNDYSNPDTFNETQAKAVSDLLYVCGVMVHMDYCRYSSGSFLTSAMLENNFGIDKGCNDLDRQYYNTAEWDGLIKSELNAGRPVIYSGGSSNGGHSFVCDGYNQEGLFHINWGWSGYCDGYFQLSALNTSAESAGQPTDGKGNYNMSQDIVCGIQPAGTPGTLREQQQLYYHQLQVENGTCTKEEAQKTPVGVEYIGTDGNGFKGELALGLFDAEGKLCQTYKIYDIKDLPPHYSYGTMSVCPDYSSVPTGKYTLLPVCKSTSDTEYKTMQGLQGLGKRLSVTVNVTENTVEYFDRESDYKPGLTLSNQVELFNGKAYAGCENNLSLEIHNAGEMFNGVISVVRRGVDRDQTVFSNNYVIERNATVQLPMTIAAPEGREKDELEIYVCMGDVDEAGNPVQILLGTVSYTLLQPATGEPALQLQNLSMSNLRGGEALSGGELHLQLQVANQGGMYNEPFYFFVYPENGGYSQATYTSTKPLLNQGEQTTITVKGKLEGLPDGTYRVMPSYISGNYIQDLMDFSDCPTFTVVTVPEQRLVIYNEMQAQLATLKTVAEKPWGTAYGEYMGAKDLFITQLQNMEANIQTLNYSAMNTPALEGLASELQHLQSAVQLNQPEEGDLFCIRTSPKNTANVRYMSANGADAATFSPVTWSGTPDAATIFCYLGNQLVSYTNGYYLQLDQQQAGYQGVQAEGMKMRFEEARGLAEDRAFTLCDWSNQKSLQLTGDRLELAEDTGNGTHNFILEEISSLPVTISEVGYATLYAPVSLTVPAGVEAYVGQDEDSILRLTPVQNVIPANTAVVLVGDAGTYDFQCAAPVDVTYSNALHGSLASEIPAGEVYTLQEIGDVVGMYPFEGNYLKGFKAYLVGKSGVGGFRFEFDDVTGLENVVNAGAVVKYYDLQGRRVYYPAHGVYVTEKGQKVYFK